MIQLTRLHISSTSSQVYLVGFFSFQINICINEFMYKAVYSTERLSNAEDRVPITTKVYSGVVVCL